MPRRAKKIERATRLRSANSDSLIHNLSATLSLYAKKERMSIENAKNLENNKNRIRNRVNHRHNRRVARMRGVLK